MGGGGGGGREEGGRDGGARVSDCFKTNLNLKNNDVFFLFCEGWVGRMLE